MIHVEGLKVHLDGQAVVDGVSFTVAEGDSVALWGDNGAGKTTVIRALLGLLPFRGRIEVGGHDLRRAGRRARALIGYVPQQLALYDELSALGYLRFMAGLRRAPAAEPERLLARVGLGEEGAKSVGALSGGMRQRLALAGALLGDPPLLLLDEPTASLDASARSDFLRLLGDLRGPRRTLVLTTHRLEELAALADQVLVLEQGRLTLVCPAADLAVALDLGNTLRLRVAGEQLGEALALLDGMGFTVRRNGHGLLVRVSPGERGAPIHALAVQGIAVQDLAVEEGGWTPESS